MTQLGRQSLQEVVARLGLATLRRTRTPENYLHARRNGVVKRSRSTLDRPRAYIPPKKMTIIA